MSEPVTRAIERLAERGDARGADRVFYDARSTPEPRARRRVALAIAASFVAIVVLGTALATRSRTGEFVPVVPVAAAESVHGSLAGSVFAVESVTIDGEATAPDQPVTASFDTEFVRFVAACGFVGEIGYRLEGDRFVWSDDPWFVGSGTSSVSGACPSTTVELLRTTMWDGAVEVQGDKVLLRNSMNGASTTLRRVGDTPQPPLFGSRWWLWHASRHETGSAGGCGRTRDAPCSGLEAQFGDPDMTEELPSVVLNQSGATLDVACASGPTSASWAGDRVELGTPSTEPGCDPNAGVEVWLLDSLPGEFTVRLDGQHLTLLADDGTTLFFHTNAL